MNIKVGRSPPLHIALQHYTRQYITSLNFTINMNIKVGRSPLNRIIQCNALPHITLLYITSQNLMNMKLGKAEAYITLLYCNVLCPTMNINGGPKPTLRFTAFHITSNYTTQHSHVSQNYT